jgi:hypothetical protein
MLRLGRVFETGEHAIRFRASGDRPDQHVAELGLCL